MGNITTIDPRGYAQAVDAPEICEVRSLKSGRILDARKFIESLRYDKLIRLRSAIREAMDTLSPRVACAICGTPVYLVASPEKAFFFRHSIEDGSCPALTRSGLTEADIRAMKYKGAQESAAHRRLKSFIERSLVADPRFHDIFVEKTWRATRDLKALRRPDVQARFGDQRIAFEAQLSTTFLSVVIGRKVFYRSEGALLVWVLPYFDPTYRRLTTDDVLFNNNSNILVIDASTVRASESAGRFMVRCAFPRPALVDASLQTSWEERIVDWGDLRADVKRQWIFLFDYESADRELTKALADAAAEKAEALKDALRNELFSLLSNQADTPDREVTIDIWTLVRQKFLRYGFVLPETPNTDYVLRNIVCGVLSARAGRPIGYKFSKLIQVAHHLADQCPEALLPFGYTLSTSGNQRVLLNQDISKRWQTKAIAIREAIAAGRKSYLVSPARLGLLSFLFPDIAHRLAASLESLHSTDWET